MNDILIYSATLHDHVDHLRKIFQLLKDNELFVKTSKCSFAQTSLEYLGHIVSREGMATDPNQTSAMVAWPRPTNFTELRGILGFTGYYRKFVESYGIIAKPLTSLLKQKVFQWSSEAEEALNRLKQAMTTTPKPFVLEINACGTGVGAVLMQEQRTIAFLSKALSAKHSDLPIYEKEFLALIMAVERWRPYLQRGKFVIKTDHQSLTFLDDQTLHSPLQRD